MNRQTPLLKQVKDLQMQSIEARMTSKVMVNLIRHLRRHMKQHYVYIRLLEKMTSSVAARSLNLSLTLI